MTQTSTTPAPIARTVYLVGAADGFEHLATGVRVDGATILRLTCDSTARITYTQMYGALPEHADCPSCSAA